MKLDKFYINGEWVSPVKDEKIDVINPSDESVIGTLNVGSQQDIDKAVEAAKIAFQNYERRPAAQRCSACLQLFRQADSGGHRHFSDHQASDERPASQQIQMRFRPV